MHSPTSQVAALISRGKEQGYLTYAEVNDHLRLDYRKRTD
jgi:RNA polymerase primary sigma factor